MNKDVKTYWVIKTVFRWVAVIFHTALVLPLIFWFKYMLPANGVDMDIKIFALVCLLSMYFAGFLLSIILSFSKPARETKEVQQ